MKVKRKETLIIKLLYEDALKIRAEFGELHGYNG
jgi:hypothetical protein